MSSEELLRDLRTMDWLIAALSTQQTVDDEDLEDLHWLRARRKFLATLLETRIAQRGKKVVSLELWRGGCAAMSQQAAKVA